MQILRIFRVRTLFAAFALTSSVLPCLAANRLPQTFIGNWCSTGKGDLYSVGRCSDPGSDRRLTVRPHEFEGHEHLCEVVKVIKERVQYAASFQCSGEGEKWPAAYRMSLQTKGKRKYLKMTSIE
jgi:hypothetical protein